MSEHQLVTVQMPAALVAAIDKERGLVDRSTWIRHTLARAVKKPALAKTAGKGRPKA
jgi:metal-responsive CopG/Arc/MetJ family transcriptional regulator